MQKQKIPYSRKIIIPALHTYLVKQYEIICEYFKINLIKGSAQIYGLELKKYYPHLYHLPTSLPIWTWQGCQIIVQWFDQQTLHPSDQQWCDLTQNHCNVQNPMLRYLQIHYQLTCLRKLALQNQKQGPRVALIGGQNTGIQNISRLMLNYAGKLNMNPIFIDLDLENSLFVDGTLSAATFQYKITQDLFDRPNKICFYYGKRKVKKQSYLKIVKILAQTVNIKLQKQYKSYSQKGSLDEYPSFCSGIIVQCPRINDKQDKKYQKQLLYEILKLFSINHVITIDNPQISASIIKNITQIEKYNTIRLQGTQSYLELPRPLKTKINRYFDQQYSRLIIYKINQIILYQYQPILENLGVSYCRLVNIKQQLINKSTIAILNQQYQSNLNQYQLANKVEQSSIYCLTFISAINDNQITLLVTTDNFIEQCKDKLWILMSSENMVL